MEDEPGEEVEALKPFWSGVVTFGLVSVPVSLFAATRGTRLRLRMVDAEGVFLERKFFGAQGPDALDAADLVRGHEVAKDRFVTIADDELDALDPEKSREIDLAQFVPLDALSPLHFEQAYFLVPDGSTTKAYRLLAETLAKEKRAGIATFVMRGREYLCAIIAEHGILRAETLRFADEVRSPEAIGLPPRVPAKAAAVAEFASAIKSLKAKTLDRSELADNRTARIVELAEKKLKAGTDVVRARADTEQDGENGKRETRREKGQKAQKDDGSTNVVDLMEVLRERLRGKLRARSAPAGGEADAPPSAVAKLSSKSREELYEMARSRDVPGRSGMSKAKLIGVLSQKSR